MKKTLVILGVVGAVILVVFGWLTQGFWWRKYQENKILREYAALENAYKNDPYGGSTPEETLALFIDALKKGDAELASNYFIPEKREEYKKAVTNWIRLGKNNDIATQLANVNNNRRPNSAEYQMSAVGLNNIASLIVNFRENKYTEKWLIESL